MCHLSVEVLSSDLVGAHVAAFNYDRIARLMKLLRVDGESIPVRS
jgi:hypothetical protein